MQTRILAALVVAGSLLAFGCGPSGDSAEHGGAAQGSTDEEREKQARALMMAASARSLEQKIPLYERVIGLFPDSELVVEARFRLVHVLLHPRIDRADDALEAVRVMAARHPTDARTAEAWWWMALHWREHDQRGPAIMEEWAQFLETTRGREMSDSSAKGWVWLHSSYASYWAGDRDQAMAYLDEASDWDLEDTNVQLRILFRGGSLQRELGRKQQAAAFFERALDLVEGGARGVSAPAIQSELEALKDD